MNIELRRAIAQALQDYRNWVDGGAIVGGGFNSAFGLCKNIMHYSSIRDAWLGHVIFEELADMFREDGLCEITPFNPEEFSYSRDSANRVHHKNAARMAWVDAVIEKYKEGV